MKQIRNAQKMAAVILSIALVVSLLPTGMGMKTVQAGNGTLYIGNTLVTESNASDVLGDQTVSYDRVTNTLTLKGASLSIPAGTDEQVYGIRYEDSGQTLHLVLHGRNTITIPDAENTTECYGIYTKDSGALHILGTGTLDITTGSASDYSVGIYTGNLSMESGTVAASSGRTEKYKSVGIYAKNGMNVTGGSLTGNGAFAGSESCGIRVEGAKTQILDGIVNGIGGDCVIPDSSSKRSTNSLGIYTGTTTYIEGGKVTAKGGSMTVEQSGDHTGNSYGLQCNAALYIQGGNTSCTGGTAITKSVGIYEGWSIFYIEDGVLTATGGNAPKSYGASCGDALHLTGGEKISFFGNTKAYENINSAQGTFGDKGYTLFAKAGENSTAASDTVVSDEVLSGNQYVTVTAKMDITKVESSFGGSYTLTPAQTTAVAKGTTITIKAAPWSGCRLEKIDVKGTRVSKTVTVNGNSFKMPGYPVTINVTFGKIPCNHKIGKWIGDKNGHQRSCTLCYTVLEKGTHLDNNKDGKCDVCNYDLRSQQNKPSTNTNESSSPNEGTSTTTTQKKKPYVKLNVSSIPLQVKKSTSAVKITKKYPANDKVKSYKSSNTKVAVVNKKGKVTAKKAGKATITITMKSGAKAKYTVKVQKGKVVTKSLKLNKKSCTLKKGKSFTLTAARNPLTATEKITYKTSNKKVAVVNSKGKITAKKKGKATITVKTSNGKKAVCKVTVK